MRANTVDIALMTSLPEASACCRFFVCVCARARRPSRALFKGLLFHSQANSEKFVLLALVGLALCVCVCVCDLFASLLNASRSYARMCALYVCVCARASARFA